MIILSDAIFVQFSYIEKRSSVETEPRITNRLLND